MGVILVLHGRGSGGFDVRVGILVNGGISHYVLRNITGKWEKMQAGETWETPAAEEVLRAAGTKLVAEYIG